MSLFQLEIEKHVLNDFKNGIDLNIKDLAIEMLIKTVRIRKPEKRLK